MQSRLRTVSSKTGKLWVGALCGLLMASCSTQDVQPISEPEPSASSPQRVETQIGAEEHRAVRQLLGGDFRSDPALLSYVRQVGGKLAASADTGLRYEFSIVDNSVSQAWALPGGQIIVSRGMLQSLDCEAQLAAVLASQIARVPEDQTADLEQSEFVSPDARTTAQRSVVDNPFTLLVVGDGALAANLLAEQRASTDSRAIREQAERYLLQAGYDPAASADVQAQRLSSTNVGEPRTAIPSTQPEERDERPAGQEHRADRPRAEPLRAPVQAARERNPVQQANEARAPVQAADQRKAAKQANEDRGCDAYQAATATLRKLAPAYDAYDASVTALKQGHLAEAQTHADKARSLASDQARFHVLLGDIAVKRGQPNEALAHFQRAIELNPEYFEPYVSAGIAAYQLGDRDRAAKLLDRSMTLLPTAPAAFHLARISQESGNVAQAIQYYQLAGSSDSVVGRDAARELVLLDLPRNPGRYVHAEPKIDPSTGKVWLEVSNEAPVAVDRIVLAAALAKPEGGLAKGPVEVETGATPLEPGTRTRVATPLGPLPSSDSLDLIRTQVQAAEVAGAQAVSPSDRDKPPNLKRTADEPLR